MQYMQMRIAIKQIARVLTEFGQLDPLFWLIPLLHFLQRDSTGVMTGAIPSSV